MEYKSDTTCNRSTNIGPQIMEYRPNSKRDPSADISKVESPILSLTEHYIITRTINQWVGPKYLTYSTQEARLRSFITYDWPHVLQPTPSALSDAGFSR